jgi:hypothetical protein
MAKMPYWKQWCSIFAAAADPASVHYYNSEIEIDRFVPAIVLIARQR